MIYNLYKNPGETPLERIGRFVKTDPKLEEEKMCYLGRLDPLAEGILLVASDKDIKKREELLKLDKEYEFTAVFGFATDTYDVMGKISNVKNTEGLSEMDLIKVCKLYEGEREQEYPKYSSKYLSGKQKPPQTKKIKIHKLDFLGLYELRGKELFGRLLMDIGRVKGNFRQMEILEEWKGLLFEKEETYLLAHLKAEVSSGTYIRSLVNEIGKTLGCGATVLHIKRTRVGDYKIEDSMK